MEFIYVNQVHGQEQLILMKIQRLQQVLLRFVEEGTTNADNGFVLTTNGTITVGTTALSFSQFSGAGNITAGDGLNKSGNELSVDLKANGGLVMKAIK